MEDAHGRHQGEQQEETKEVEKHKDPAGRGRTGQRERLVLMQPPKILLSLGLVKEGEM